MYTIVEMIAAFAVCFSSLELILCDLLILLLCSSQNL
jgi:hypothetical protein